MNTKETLISMNLTPKLAKLISEIERDTRIEFKKRGRMSCTTFAALDDNNLFDMYDLTANTDDSQEISNYLHSFCSVFETKNIVMFSENWMVKSGSAETEHELFNAEQAFANAFEKYGSLEFHPNRQEVLLITIESEDQVITGIAKVKNKKLGATVWESKPSQISGPLTGFINKNKYQFESIAQQAA